MIPLSPNSFYITGMSCSSCVSKITTAVNARPDAEITISLVTAQATVKLKNGGAPPPRVIDDVKGVVKELGFGVEEGEQEGGFDEFASWR
jgi:copper chaperone CopZ